MTITSRQLFQSGRLNTCHSTPRQYLRVWIGRVRYLRAKHPTTWKASIVLDPLCLLLGVPVTPWDSVPFHVVIVVCFLPVSTKHLSYCLGSQGTDCITHAKQRILTLPHMGSL